MPVIPARLTLTLMGVAIAAITAMAQTPAAQTPAPQALTYEMALQVIDAAGIPVVLRRLTGARPRSYDIASRKAATVVASKMTTAEYGAQLKTKAVAEVPNGITFAGGVPILRGSEFIGAVGTSGVTAAQDDTISKAGAAVVQ